MKASTTISSKKNRDMKTIKEAIEANAAVLHRMGNSLNTVLHGCYEDAGVTPKQMRAAVDDLIKGFAEMKIIHSTIKENYLDKGAE